MRLVESVRIVLVLVQFCRRSKVLRMYVLCRRDCTRLWWKTSTSGVRLRLLPLHCEPSTFIALSLNDNRRARTHRSTTVDSASQMTCAIYAARVTIWIFIFIYNWTKLTAPTTTALPMVQLAAASLRNCILAFLSELSWMASHLRCCRCAPRTRRRFCSPHWHWPSATRSHPSNQAERVNRTAFC